MLFENNFVYYKSAVKMGGPSTTFSDLFFLHFFLAATSYPSFVLSS